MCRLTHCSPFFLFTLIVPVGFYITLIPSLDRVE